MEKLVKWIKEVYLLPYNFCPLNISSTASMEDFQKELVVLKEDFTSSVDGSYNYITFTTKAKLHTFKKLVVMAESRK